MLKIRRNCSADLTDFTPAPGVTIPAGGLTGLEALPPPLETRDLFPRSTFSFPELDSGAGELTRPTQNANNKAPTPPTTLKAAFFIPPPCSNHQKMQEGV
ncbi:MAG: hypothetical protein ACPG32_13565 [Akkermansiaceae bacterium]